MSTNPTGRMAERRRFIEKRTAELEAELAALVAEANEIDVTERVLARFSEPPSIGANAEKPLVAAPNGGDDEPALPEPPTLPKMVFTILEEAKAQGRKGVDGNEILRIIRARWKPDFTADKVRPTLWRMVKKEGRLKKRGKMYSMPPSSPEGETEAVGASARH
jgi:hypothetical protein